MSFNDIAYERDGSTALVTLDRPERRNALSLAMLGELTRCFRDVGADAEVRVAILRANGTAFSAGHDLGALVGRDVAFYRQPCEAMSAEEAQAAGLVNRVVPAAGLAAATKAIAAKIAASSPYVVAVGKAAFYRQLQMPQPLAYDYAQDVMSMNAAAADAQEGMK